MEAMFGRMEAKFGRKSREPRRKLNQDGWIKLNGSFATRKCTVIDISRNGASLKIEDPAFMYEKFSLKLSRTEPAGRPCKVTWRNGSTVGVKFEA
jgi:hypothetical protein